MSDENNDQTDETPQPRTNQMVRRTFEGLEMAGENSATQALIAKATADIQARWMIAIRRPRQMDDVRANMIKECRRPAFARKAIYSLPRGNKTIRGLTIRFAEMAMSAMGNMSVEAQTLFDDHTHRIVRLTVTNFEGNSTWSSDLYVPKTKEVKQLGRGQRAIQSRANSYGDIVHLVDATDDDVAMKQAALISKASRTGILRLVPASLISECFERCETVSADEAAKDPDGEKKKILDAFAEHNVQPSWLAEWLGHPVEQVTPAQLVELRHLLVAIREGEATLQEAMAVADDRRARAAKAKPETKQEAKTDGNGKPAQSAPASGQASTSGAAPATDRKVGGKGAQAVKDRVSGKTDAAQAGPAPAVAQDIGKTAKEPSPDIKPDPARKEEATQQTLLVAAATRPTADDTELRDCVMCGGPIECLKTDPAGGQCEACRNS